MYLSKFASGSPPGQVGMPKFTGTLPNTGSHKHELGMVFDYTPPNSLAERLTSRTGAPGSSTDSRMRSSWRPIT